MINYDEILGQVNQIFIDILDNPALSLKAETTANDVEDWDSLTHIQLVVAIEKHYKVRFTAKEIQSWKNVRELITRIQNKVV